MAKILVEMGFPVVVSASGYGSLRSVAATLAPEGPLLAKEWGDEPALIRWLMPDLPIVVGRRRVLAAELCHVAYPDAVLLLDDGYQHLPLAKDLSILIDPVDRTNRWCLPAGPYRQPSSDRARADLVLPDSFCLRPEFGPVLTPEGVEVKPQTVQALCAIGSPQSFLDSLVERGYVVERSLVLADHADLSDKALRPGYLNTRFEQSLPIVVTAKDWMKLMARPDVGDWKWAIAHYSVRIEPEAEFREWLKVKLSEIQQKSD
jgi:tetraacyldisaccharide 4'-kinase